MGIRKPDARIYSRALGILGMKPERVIFIDDRLENVAAAAAVGMKALNFTGADTLRRELQGLEVL
jgi:HAD superfamily hydrolase (TIGR01509 family)